MNDLQDQNDQSHMNGNCSHIYSLISFSVWLEFGFVFSATRWGNDMDQGAIQGSPAHGVHTWFFGRGKNLALYYLDFPLLFI